MKLTIFSLRPMSAASILLLLVAFLAWPSANRVVAASIPDKINLAGNNGADWKNAIPSNGELARSARIAALMYQVSAVPCTSRLKLDGGSSMINHPGCRLLNISISIHIQLATTRSARKIPSPGRTAEKHCSQQLYLC